MVTRWAEWLCCNHRGALRAVPQRTCRGWSLGAAFYIVNIAFGLALAFGGLYYTADGAAHMATAGLFSGLVVEKRGIIVAQ